MHNAELVKKLMELRREVKVQLRDELEKEAMIIEEIGEDNLEMLVGIYTRAAVELRVSTTTGLGD